MLRTVIVNVGLLRSKGVARKHIDICPEMQAEMGAHAVYTNSICLLWEWLLMS